MTNWCYNSVHLNGSKETIKQIAGRLESTLIRTSSEGWWSSFKDSPYTDEEMDKAKEQGLLEDPGKCVLSRLLDYKDLGATCKEEDYSYSEALTLTGTKWDPEYEFYISLSEHDDVYGLNLNMESAWTPPERGILLVARKYGVDLDMEYEEGGCDFAGILKYDSASDTVRSASLSYMAYRFLEHDEYEISTDPKALSAEVTRFVLNEWDLDHESDNPEVPPAVEHILGEIQGLTCVEDIEDKLCEPVPAAEWVRSCYELSSGALLNPWQHQVPQKTTDVDA